MGKTRLLREHPDGRRPGAAWQHRLVSDSRDIGTGRGGAHGLSRRRYRLVGPARRAQPDDGAVVNVPASLGGTLLARGSPSVAAPAPQEGGVLTSSAWRHYGIPLRVFRW